MQKIRTHTYTEATRLTAYILGGPEAEVGRGATAALIYRRGALVLYLSREPAAHCVLFMSRLARPACRARLADWTVSRFVVLAIRH